MACLHHASLIWQVAIGLQHSWLEPLSNSIHVTSSPFMAAVRCSNSLQHHLAAGLQKRYTVPCLEAEILQATVDKDNFPTFLLAEAGELNRCRHLRVSELMLCIKACKHRAICPSPSVNLSMPLVKRFLQ